MNILISFAIMFFFIIVLAVILSLLPLPQWKQKKKGEGEGEGEETGGKPPDKSKITEIIKISAAGAIFLILLYALVPEFIIKHHKEIIILVAAMITGATLLGIWQDWEKSSTRKILKAHFVVLSIIIISIILYKDLEIKKWTEIQKEETKPAWSYTLKADEKIFTDVIIGKGVNLKFRSSAPFYVISGQKDGMTKKYPMPAGESSWIGDDPRGPLTLEGRKKTTINIVLY